MIWGSLDNLIEDVIRGYHSLWCRDLEASCRNLETCYDLSSLAVASNIWPRGSKHNLGEHGESTIALSDMTLVERKQRKQRKQGKQGKLKTAD